MLSTWDMTGANEAGRRIIMLDQPPGQCCGLGGLAGGVGFSQAQHAISDREDDAIERLFRNPGPQVPEVEEPSELDQETLTRPLVALPWRCGEELGVSYQMGQARLLKAIGVSDVGAERVAGDGAAVGFREDIFQDLQASRLGDAEEGDGRGAEDPDPILQAPVLPSGLVDIQDRFSGQVLSELSIRLAQGVADTGDGVSQVASGRAHVQDVATALVEAGTTG